MRDRELRQWRALVRDRADREWRALSSDVVDELACHLADLHGSALAVGASDDEARRRALDVLNAASFLELSKRPRARRFPGGHMHDIRLAVRQLRATPIVTVVAVLSLALGIGANTAMFSIVDSLVLRALPVRQPGRLAIVSDDGHRAYWMTYPIWSDIQSRHLFENAFAWSTARFNLAERGETEFVDGIWTSAGIFDTLGIAPILGRGFTDADDRRGGGPDGPIAVISYSFWQRRFGGAADTVGRRLTLERIPFTIVGIMPPDFFGPDVGRRFDVAIPLGAEPLVRGKETFLDGPWTWWLAIMGRLKPPQSIETATASFRGVLPQIRAATLPPNASPETWASNLKDTFTLIPAANGDSGLRARYQRPLIAMMIVVALVLLIACANIANLLLARAAARVHEMSIRRALGASPWRLARQLLVESLVLSTAGALLGWLVARWGSQLLVRELSTQTNTVFLDLSLDWRVLGFTATVTVATALLFGIAPAFRSSKVEPIDALKEHGSASARGTSTAMRIFAVRINLAGSLVVAQVALSVVLVVAAGLFVRTFSKLATLPLGFDRDRLLVVTVDMQRAPIDAVTQSLRPAQRVPTLERALESVRRLPGVRGAGLSLLTPVSDGGWNGRFEVPGGVPLTDRERRAYRNMVSPGWFATFGTLILAGRDFAETDRAGAPPVAIVNEAFARHFLNGANPVGRTVRQAARAPGEFAPAGFEIIGLAADAIYKSVRDPVPPTVYTSIFQPGGPPFASLRLTVRAAIGPPALLSRSVAAAMTAVNPDFALTFRTMSDSIDASLTQERVVAMLSGFFGGLALLLAGLGLYGVTAYAVARRRTEIGIRMALGAAPGGVVRLVLTRVVLLIAAGIALGAGLGAWAAQFVASLLYGLEPRDPATLAAAAITLAATGTLAGWLPARRAARIDPAAALRES
jgi:putative ABC transport system permease protein